MLTAVKKPIPITVVEFVAPTEAAPLQEHVQQRDDGTFFVFNAKHQSEINLAPGDYLNVTDAGDVYPIARDVFERTYDLVTDTPAPEPPPPAAAAVLAVETPQGGRLEAFLRAVAGPNAVPVKLPTVAHIPRGTDVVQLRIGNIEQTAALTGRVVGDTFIPE